MSQAFYPLHTLRFWNQGEIRQRQRFVGELVETLERALLDLNQGWRFEQVEAPLIMPLSQFSGAYTPDDIFMLDADSHGEKWALRAETTPGTYVMAEHLLLTSKIKPPAVFWQAGPSFRRELTDGARAGTLRFNQFWQLEFQCIYDESSGAAEAYVEQSRAALAAAIWRLVGQQTRLVPSDRLPAYASETVDIESMWRGEWKEVASTSRRTDFKTPKPYQGTDAKRRKLVCFEIAIGLDRLLAVANGEP